MSQTAVQLNKLFDVPELEHAFQSLSHLKSNPAGYPGEGNVSWNSITLYSMGSHSNELESYLPSLSALNLRIRLVRFMLLEPKGIIKKYQDSFLSERIVRLHLPVITHQDVEFYLDDERCNWKAGELWYGDFSKPHYAVNNSDVTRVHLVLDVTCDDNLLKLFPPNKLPDKLSRSVNANTNQEYNANKLKRFDCDFSLPSGFNLPGINYAQLEAELTGKIRLIDEELCVLVNDQPLLKAIPITEDKLELIGLGFDASVDYVFYQDAIKNLTLDMAGTRIPITLVASTPRAILKEQQINSDKVH